MADFKPESYILALFNNLLCALTRGMTSQREPEKPSRKSDSESKNLRRQILNSKFYDESLCETTLRRHARFRTRSFTRRQILNLKKIKYSEIEGKHGILKSGFDSRYFVKTTIFELFVLFREAKILKQKLLEKKFFNQNRWNV